MNGLCNTHSAKIWAIEELQKASRQAVISSLDRECEVIKILNRTRI